MRAAALVTAALAVLLLVGCSAGGGTDGGAGDPAPTTTEAGDTPGDDTAGDDAVSGAVAIPETYPRDAVPLVEGTPVFAIDLGTGWTVVVEVDDFAAGYDEAVGLLEGAGFAATAESTTAEGSTGQFTTDDYLVNLTATDSPDYGPSVSYTVVITG